MPLPVGGGERLTDATSKTGDCEGWANAAQPSVSPQRALLNQYCVGVDLGGTKIAASVVDVGSGAVAARQIMLHVHTRGVGVAGVFPFDVAETKAHQVVQFAREHEMPLQASVRRSKET
jgi:hypothetical protein